MARGLVWEGDLLKGKKVLEFEARVRGAMVAGAKFIEPQAEAHMKTHAPWTDQTGNARNGLKAQTIVEADSVSIVLFHQVPYGPYLELRWSGRYAVIMPTVEAFAPELVRTISRLAF